MIFSVIFITLCTAVQCKTVTPPKHTIMQYDRMLSIIPLQKVVEGKEDVLFPHNAESADAAVPASPSVSLLRDQANLFYMLYIS